MYEDVFVKFPVLELDDLVLREIGIADAPAFLDYVIDPQVNKYLSEEDIPKNLAEAERELKYWGDLFQNKRSIYWAIARKKDNKLIGTCGFNAWSRVHSRVEISYDLARSQWNKGIMTKCVRSICDYAFLRLNANRIQATVAQDNIGSIKVLSKLGFKQEGELREYGILHGVKKDFYMYSFISKDLVF
jgi:ribosomal-protein-alanine N-acetyltransferase